MKVNFDGMRTNATRNMNELHDVIKNVIDADYILDSQKEELIEACNDAAHSVDIFKCLEDENDENFNSIDDLEIQRLEEIEDEEDEEDED